MQHTTYPRTSIRRLAVGILLSALLLAPVPAYAASKGCNIATSKSGMIGDIRTVISAEATQRSPLTFRLTFHMQMNGAVRGHGVIHSGGAGAAITTATAPYSPVIIAARQVIDATCDDLDGNGTAGLTSISLVFQNPSSGHRIPVTLQSTEGDIDADGVYAVAVQVGTASMIANVRVRLSQDRTHHHRRR